MVQKKKIRQKNGEANGIPSEKFDLYDLHDGKILYHLTQHFLYNKIYLPFLLCKYTRGQGVVNNDDHVCELISHDVQVRLYNRSFKRWNNERARLLPGEMCNKKWSYGICWPTQLWNIAFWITPRPSSKR